jgi:hypothetical protein
MGRNPSSQKTTKCDFDRILAVKLWDILAASRIANRPPPRPNCPDYRQHSIKNPRHFSLKITGFTMPLGGIPGT